MAEDYNRIARFLEDPAKDCDAFWESSALIWIDWREFDEAIIRYVNERLPDSGKIEYTLAESEKPRGVDLLLKKGQAIVAIPYMDERLDRDTTLRAVQEHLAPGYQLRWYVDSLCGDTLAFCLLPSEQWARLERAYGPQKTAYYFKPITPESKMFDLGMKEVSALLEKRQKAW